MHPDAVTRLAAVFRDSGVSDPSKDYLTTLAAGLNECWKPTRPFAVLANPSARSGEMDAEGVHVILALRRAERAIGELGRAARG